VTVSVAIWEADFRSAEVADACFVQESFGISGILWEISFLKRFAVDCVTSAIDSFMRSPVFWAVCLADFFMFSPIRAMERCASRAYCSPVCLALILAFVIEWRMLLVALVAAVFAFFVATSVASVAACVAFSVACDAVRDAVEVREPIN